MSRQTGFDARTAYKLLMIHKIGSGNTATHYLWDFPAVRLVAPPKPVQVGRGCTWNSSFTRSTTPPSRSRARRETSLTGCLAVPLRIRVSAMTNPLA